MNLLAGDLGGTKTLLGIYKFNNEITKLHEINYISKDWDDFTSILNDFIKKIPNSIEHPTYGCIGVAGQVQEGRCKITNLNWEIDEKVLCKIANLKRLKVLNDFSALIYSIPYLKRSQYIEIRRSKSYKPNSYKKNVIAIIGAGTGLGVARGNIYESNIESIPSEAGHCEFSPRSEKEWEIYQWLKNDLKLERLSIERVVSGTGLGNIARWRLTKEDAINHPLRKTIITENNCIKVELPQLVSSSARKGDPIMNEVVELWLEAYGSAAGDIALQALCTGGLWIGGGTASKHLEGIKSATFLNAMTNKGRFKGFLENIPIMGLIDPQAGLFGAACKAHLISKSPKNIS